MLAAFGKVLDFIARWLDELAKLLLVALLVLINAEIFVRYAFNSSTLVSEELSGYFLCWLTLFGFLYTARRDFFIRVQFATDQMNARWRNISGIIAALCGLFLSLVVCYATWHMVDLSWRFHSTSNQYLATPLYVPQIVMPIAYALLSLGYLEEILRRLIAPHGVDAGDQVLEGRERS